MYIIKKVEVKGFWNKLSIDTMLNDNVNIFIGKNGSGKTTFINLIEASLTVNLETLISTRFDEIIIVLQKNNRTRKISISKIEHDLQYKELHFKIGTNSYKLPIVNTRELRNFSSGRIHPRFSRIKYEIQQKLNSLLNISYLSVSREKIFNDSIEERNSTEIYNAIDNRLDQLINELTVYQLQLETEVGKLSEKFQEDVLRSMLFNEDFDYLDINKPINIDINDIKNGLSKAYEVLGILDKKTTTIIEKHTNELKKSADKINNSIVSNEKIPIYPNDVTPLTLFKRTQKIIDLSSKLDEEKKQVFKRIDKYINLLNNFHSNKYFTLQESKKGAIGIFNDGNKINASELSSGEKQLLILLTETLLQKEEKTIFIADEPELSLHIEWQRMIIDSIRELNPNSQIILATHSPEIVGKNRNCVINMEKIING